MKKIITFFSFLALTCSTAWAQPDTTDLLSLLGEPAAVHSPAIATFKGTRLINFHTIEVPGERTLDFRIAHRFGPFNDGGYNFWGLDGGASIRLSLEYSYDGRLCLGMGRSSVDKTFDGFAKYRILRQGDHASPPVSVTLFSSIFATSLRDEDDRLIGVNKYEKFSSRLSFCHQVIVARKFNEHFSLQIAPTLVHVNLADALEDKNDVVIIATAARYKVTRRLAITAEYGWRVNNYTNTKYYDSFGIGVDLETGGHVFQMHLTNSFGLTENQFFTRTTDNWGDGGIRLGFNISRVFTI
ncbi:MAG: DUF5777 family beta-barrel protein [Saprospiraceae bacterium]|nr:DUF5777 family beta-barrel protein [Saprospiraceae bacterium]MCF8252093.1 DUF5777 family beta-barrel protein [Saprospiraceae bacterium]MCF8283213.1 DUF5777 family beta-barrel protein [Bacteroidales bacterium]MCF8313736.1 DUF5777 family beta-barrel protein [Saprospiraceae bacterium]MCF8442456.1 DUF5777 family beta-barrel protein [Saprospiraceae bacterium]